MRLLLRHLNISLELLINLRIKLTCSAFYPFQKRYKEMYSTNLIEGLNRQLMRYTNCKEQFPIEDSLERIICNQFIEYNQKFLCCIHRGFDAVQNELQEIFEK